MNPDTQPLMQGDDGYGNQQQWQGNQGPHANANPGFPNQNQNQNQSPVYNGDFDFNPSNYSFDREKSLDRSFDKSFDRGRDRPFDKSMSISHSAISRRAALGWSCAFFGCVSLEIAGSLGYYQRGLSFALSCQLVVFLFTLLMTNLVFSRRGKDKHRQNWLLNLAFVLALTFGLMGGLVGGHYFSRWGDLDSRTDHTKVSPDTSPLTLRNPGRIAFEKGTTLRTSQMGAAQFTSTNRLENRFRWYACATPIVSPSTGTNVNFWAITEGTSPCTAPIACEGEHSCYGYVLTDDNHAAGAVDAAVQEYGFSVKPGATYMKLLQEPAGYTGETLEKALASVVVPLLLFPLFTFFLYYIITVYEVVFYMPFTGAQFPKYNHNM